MSYHRIKQGTENPRVGGSIPSLATIIKVCSLPTRRTFPLFRKASTIAAIVAALALTACATTPRQFEDDRVILIDGVAWVKDADTKTFAEINAIAAEYTVPVLDDAERKACRRVLWGQGADLATTGIGLALGCSEANPLFGGNVAAIVAVKGYLMLACQAQAESTPAAFSMARTANWSAAVGAGAAAWNLTQLAGCGL